MEKYANSARHTAKSVTVDGILRGMYTFGFDESPPVEGGYNPPTTCENLTEIVRVDFEKIGFENGKKREFGTSHCEKCNS